MMSCNCTLCYTNPEACANCSNYKATNANTSWNDVIFTDIFKDIEKFLERPVTKIKVIDLDKYDIVEKKEAKIERLEQELETSKRQKENNGILFKDTMDKARDIESKIDQLNKEIKGLEMEISELKK